MIPYSLNIINLTPYQLTPEEEQVLQLGLGFCPSESIDIYETIKDLFARKLTFNYMFDQDRRCVNLEKELAEKNKNVTIAESRALRDLILLLDEGEVESNVSDGTPDSPSSGQMDIISNLRHPNPKPSLKRKSRAFPDLMTCPSIWAFLHECILSLKKEQWQTLPSNLTQQQFQAVTKLKKIPILL